MLLALLVAALAPTLTDSPPAFAQIRDGYTVLASLDLNGVWSFRATDESEWREARVPGSVHTDLIRVGRLEDPFYRDNEVRAQWVEKKEWEYLRRFDVDPAFLRHDKIVLECRGLDTIAEVYLNGAHLATTINMFVEHELDVKGRLRPGTNELRIVFRSVLDWAQREKAADPRTRVICPEGDTRLDCRKGLLYMIRKEGAAFGWDWSPRLLNSGIWKPIRLAAYDRARLTDVVIHQDLSDPNNAVLGVNAEIERLSASSLDLDVTVSFQGRTVARAQGPVRNDRASVQLAIPSPRLWWPNGWGDHPLYTVTTTLRERGRPVHARTLRTGLRRIELWREKDARGETFGVKVNGHLLFAKGGNWVPASVYPERLTEADYRKLLGSFVATHMNMIRVWGGGLYEPDVFYEFCDENGILVWQDFMFAVGPYIATEAYLDNIRREIRGVILRRRHHPSLALWCGNNESEGNMTGVQNWTTTYASATWEEYDKIFYGLIPELVKRHDPDRPYWPSSPHHPLDRERKTPEAETASGDAHDWSVWHGGKPFSAFADMTRFRFASEFGFESLPTLSTLLSFTLPEDRYVNSYVLDHHEKTALMRRDELISSEHDRGLTRIARMIARTFRMPRSFEDWVYVSQLLQGEGMRAGCEALRRSFPASTGALIWQLDDNWPVISNAMIDHYGRWKAVQYMAGRFFAPVLASAVVDGTKVGLWGVNDRLTPMNGTLRWRLARLDGSGIRHGEQAVTLAPNASALLTELDFPEVADDPLLRTYRSESFERSRQHYVWYELLEGDAVRSADAVFFTLPRYLELPEPRLRLNVRSDGAHPVVEVTAERFAAWVELGVKDSYARFSDNFFHLPPGATRRIEVIESDFSTAELEPRLFARSLVDSYR